MAFKLMFFFSGANPMIASYKPTGSLACFKNKNNFFYFEKRSGLLKGWLSSCKFTSRRIGSRNACYGFENIFPKKTSA
jgi:hypothetical protein